MQCLHKRNSEFRRKTARRTQSKAQKQAASNVEHSNSQFAIAQEPLVARRCRASQSPRIASQSSLLAARAGTTRQHTSCNCRRNNEKLNQAKQRCVHAPAMSFSILAATSGSLNALRADDGSVARSRSTLLMIGSFRIACTTSKQMILKQPATSRRAPEFRGPSSLLASAWGRLCPSGARAQSLLASCCIIQTAEN